MTEQRLVSAALFKRTCDEPLHCALSNVAYNFNLRPYSLVSEHNLLEVPVALCPFYSETQTPRTPSIAVAAGTHVYIYRNLRPYYKFTVPNLAGHTKLFSK